MRPHALALLVAPLLCACRTPGTVAVEAPTRDVRVDVAVAEASRVPLDRRRELLKTVVVRSPGGPPANDPRRPGEVLLRARDYDAWLTEFERELVRRDVQVIAGRAASPAGAATFQVDLLELRPLRRTIDLRAHRLRQRTREGLVPVESYTLDDFEVRVDAKVILPDGSVVWSGELDVPASSLVRPGTLRIDYRVEDVDPENLQVLVAPTPDAPNPTVELEWEPLVAEVARESTLPPELTPDSPELVTALLECAARRCVAEVFHQGLPGGSPDDGRGF
jgi:hypothetical protein